MKKYELHALAEVYPAMTSVERAILRDSFNEGLLEDSDPILVFEGKIIEGRHRYEMALELGVEYPVREFTGTYEQAEHLVRAKNSARRHLKPGDDALARAKMRELHAQRAPGAPLLTLKKEAEEAGVSERTMKQAVRVVRNAVPSVVKSVEEGKLSLKEADKLAVLPPDAQESVVSTPKPPPTRRTRSNTEGTLATPRDSSQQTPSSGRTWKAANPPRPEVGASKEHVAELEERIEVLTGEVDRLNLRLAVAASDATPEEKDSLQAMVQRLAEELSTMGAQLAAVTESRDALMRENRELTSQCTYYRKRLKGLGKDLDAE